MTTTKVRIGDVLELERIPVDVVPSEVYHQIGIRSYGNGIFHRGPDRGDELSKLNYYSLNPDRLVVSNIMAWEGAIALSGPSEDGFVASSRFLSYRRTGNVDLCYLNYFFQSGQGISLIRGASTGTVTRNQTVTPKNFENIEVSLPDIDEQRRIAAKLDSTMDRYARIGSLAPDLGREQVGNLLLSGTERILQRWKSGTVRVRDACEMVNDTVHPGDDPGEAAEFVGLEHIVPNLGSCIGSRPVDNEKGRKFRFAPGDILYGYLRPYLNKVWTADRPGLCSVEQYVLRPNSEVPADLLAYCLRSKGLVDAVNELTNKLQLPRLRSKLLLDLEIPYIAPPEQHSALKELDALVDKISRLVRLNTARKDTVESLRSSLLNAAFSGKL